MVNFTATVLKSPCNPSPCGPNSRCQAINGQPVCSCVEGYTGSPPGCRPECIINSDCALNRACINQKCSDPCPGTCGISAQCQVINHNPICSCPPILTGDPFVRCFPRRMYLFLTHSSPSDSEEYKKTIYFLADETIVRPNPCTPNPCGPSSQCQVINDAQSCSCLPEFIGSPPNCRPECVSNSECATRLACINQKCRDPCQGSCGANAECNVINHVPMCSCSAGFTGDAFVQCTIKQCKPIFIFQISMINLYRRSSIG